MTQAMLCTYCWNAVSCVCAKDPSSQGQVPRRIGVKLLPLKPRRIDKSHMTSEGHKARGGVEVDSVILWGCEDIEKSLSSQNF